MLADDGRTATPLDQLVLFDESAESHSVRISPAMSPESLRRAVSRLGLGTIVKTFGRFNKEDEPRYRQLFLEAWPDSQYEAQPDIPAGEQPVLVEIRFTVTELFFRAIAKIAFHYYLTQSIRSQGREDHFQEIRGFIEHGGGAQAVNKFFPEEDLFGFVGFPPGMVPSRWHHILAASEGDDGVVRAMVLLFVGPESPGEKYVLQLARLPSRISLLKSRWAHSYDYYRPTEATASCAGEVHPVSIMRMRR